MKQIHEHYQQLRDRLGASNGLRLPELGQRQMRVTTREFTTSALVWAHLQSLQLEEGWYQTPSQQGIFLEGRWPDTDAPLLQGEFYGNHRSIRVQYLGTLWRVTEVTEADDGEACLVSTQSYLSSHPGVEKLHYRLYWRLTDHGPSVQHAGLYQMTLSNGA